MMKDIIEQTEFDFTNDEPIQQLVTMNKLCQQLQVSRNFIYTQIRAGQFPKPIKLGRISRFKKQWIADYLKRCDQNVWESQL